MTTGEFWVWSRKFLFSKRAKELLIFMVFLILSGAFWLSLTLNETYEREIEIPIAITGVPSNAVLTSNETDTLRVTVRDKGFVLVAYKYGELIKQVSLQFGNYTHNNGMGLISSQELQRHIYQQLMSSSHITAIKPEKLEFYYNYGTTKQVPVRWSGRVIPEEMFFISHISYQPDSITIYASDEKLDSINMVYTEPLNYANFRDTLQVDCRLSKIKGVKTVPDHVQVTFHTDVLTEEHIDNIPIEGINMPEGKRLRTFPAKVSVNFVSGVSVFRSLKTSDFRIIADYNELKLNPSEKCHIYLKDVPQGISRARLSVSMVDYLIESEE